MPFTIQQIQAGVTSPETAIAVEQFFGEHFNNVQDCVKKSVSGNTFRAFRFMRYGINIRPSVLYRGFIQEQAFFQHAFWHVSHQEFQSSIVEIATQLDNHWVQQTNNNPFVRIGIGRALKIVNLSLKYALLMNHFIEEERVIFRRFLDVPLDRFTLSALRCAAPDLNIPLNATMNWVTTVNQYLAIQNRIRHITEGVGRFPVHYEIWAWNMNHV